MRPSRSAYTVGSLVLLVLCAGGAMAQARVEQVPDAVTLTRLAAQAIRAASVQGMQALETLVVLQVGEAGMAWVVDEGRRQASILEQVAREAVSIEQDVAQVQARLDRAVALEKTPATVPGLHKRVAAIRDDLRQAYALAVHTLHLGRTASTAVQYMTTVVAKTMGRDADAGMVRELRTALGALQQVEATQQALLIAFQPDQVSTGLETPMMAEAVRRINLEWCGRWCR